MKENDERAESQESARLQKVVEDNMGVASGENEFFSHLIAAFEIDAARNVRKRAVRSRDQTGQP
jgi:hypothetical protein